MEEILEQHKCGRLWEVLGCDVGGISEPQISDKGLARRDNPVFFFFFLLCSLSKATPTLFLS